MNINRSLISRPRRKNRNFQRKNQAVVNIQRPLQKTPVRKFAAHTTTSSSALRFKDSTSNNTSSGQRSATSTRTYSSYDESRVILAISQGRGNATCEVGLAAIDVSKPSLILCQISDTNSYINTLTKINIFEPHEILIPLTFVRGPNRLLDKIKEHFRDTTITAVARSTFNKVSGMQYVKRLCAAEWNSILIVLQHKYYCLAAASALLNYNESVLFVSYSESSLKVEYQESEGFTIIDVSTADNLELVASVMNHSNVRHSSIFGILNYCQTKIGARTLRASILQPPYVVTDIEERLDCVSELIENPNVLHNIQTSLSKLSNVDQLLSLPTSVAGSETQECCSDRQLNYILVLNSILEFIGPLGELLGGSDLPFFVAFRKLLAENSFQVIRKFVGLLIHADARPGRGEQGAVQRCYAIKPGVNGLLDIVRKSYSERLDDMREYVKDLGEKYNLSLTLGNNSKKGYHIVLPLNQQTKRSFRKSDLNPEFIQVERLSSSVTMKTIKLINYTIRVEDIQTEVIKLSNILINQLLVELRAYMGLFYKLCEYVAKLDMLQSLAHASSITGNVRPQFNDYTELIEARHPLLNFLSDTEPVPNSISVSERHNVHVITGPNSSGKSVLIRQLLLLQVVAQVGCYVPAAAATFRACDRVLARVHFDDAMECDASSFALEIRQAQYFRAVLTDRSLVIVDELCRATSAAEGAALAVAICEDLAAAAARAFVLFATHYVLMTEVAGVHPNVRNWQMETLESVKNNVVQLSFTYNLLPGVTTTKKYGLFAATTVWPESIVREAEKYFHKIQQSTQSSGSKKAMSPAFRLKYDLESELKMLKLKRQLDCATLNSKLIEYFVRLKELGYDLDSEEEVQLTVRTLEVSSTLKNSLEPNRVCEATYSESKETEDEATIRNMEEESIRNEREESISNEEFIRNAEEDAIRIAEEDAIRIAEEDAIRNPEDDAILSANLSIEINKRICENGGFSRHNSEADKLTFPGNVTFSDSNVSEDFIPASLSPIFRDDRKENFDVSEMVQEVQSLSEYFDDWEEGKDVMSDSSSTISEPPKKKVLIQSVHVFDKDNNLVDVQIHPEPKNIKKHEENISKNEKNRVLSPDLFEETNSSIKNHSIIDTSRTKNIFETSQSSDIFQFEESESKQKSESTNSTFRTPTSRRLHIRRAPFKTPLKHPSAFPQPKPLTKQQILKSHRKTMEQCIESSIDEESAAKNMKRLLNMPSVGQLRQRKVLAKICKTETGAVVVPVMESERKSRKPVPWRQNPSANFDKTVLSDKNSSRFDELLKTKKSEPLMFHFDEKPDNFDLFETRLSPKVEEGFNPGFDIESPSFDEDYYKENRREIDEVVKKYL